MSPDPWLEKQVSEFDFDKLDASEISRSMTDLMQENHGLGLAANQVGLNAQIFVIKPSLLNDKTPITFINPVIESVTVNTDTMPEGCLSHPNLFLKINRPRGVVVKYLDTSANQCTLELYDIDARVFLHEYDHLQGIEFTDRVSKLRLEMAKKKRQKQKQRNKTHG
jgi:peptide deformylase